MLESWLEYHRATLLMKCAGLNDDQLKLRSAEPSSLSLLGLVRHMAEVERSWFRRVLAGEDAPPIYYSKTDPDGDFDNVDTADSEEAFATWRGECEHARSLVATRSFDDVVTPPQSEESVSLRWIMVHMIEEYARHNGHADLLRERIDGATGD
ncbi:MAG TPA: DinB family protein [Chloroflexota bacterium]